MALVLDAAYRREQNWGTLHFRRRSRLHRQHAFDITRPSAVVTNNTLSVDGTQRNRGLEFVMFGKPFPGFKLLGGVALLDAVLTNSAGGVNNGNRAPGVSNVQLNLGFDWDTPFVRGLAVSGKVIYTGQSYLDSANTQGVPAWTRVDLGARYTFERADGKPIALRANVINVGNANYWMAGPGFFTQGMPRTYSPVPGRKFLGVAADALPSLCE